MNIKRAHDRFFRSFFADPAHLQGLLKQALPVEVAAALDLHTVQLEPGTWIDQNNRDHLSDLAASVEVRKGDLPAGRRLARIYILTEHKSWRDPEALLQLLRYMVQVWTAERRGTDAAEEVYEGHENDRVRTPRSPHPLTPIIPILVYHGPRGRMPESFSELFGEDIPEALQRYQVVFGSEILDLARTSREDLRGDPASRAALWLMRSIRRKTDDTLRELQAVLEGAEHLLSDEEYQALSRYLLETKELSIDELNAKIEALMKQGRIREGLLTTAEQLMKKGFEEGQERGLREGEELGIRKGEKLGRQKGEQVGLQKGRYQERRELAQQMLADGEDVDKILRYTHLTRGELHALGSDTP